MTVEVHKYRPFAEVVKANLQRGVKDLDRVEAAELPFYLALLASHPKINWEKATSKEVGGIIGSTAAAIHYSHSKTERGGDYLKLFGENDPKKWENVIDTVLQDPDMSQIFYDNLGRPLTTISPLRRVPLQYVLASHFGDNPIRGVDLGAGAHIALPLLHSDKYLGENGDARKKEKLIHQFGNPSNLNITLGLGIDIQNGREDKEWLKAGVWPLATNKPLVEKMDDLLADASQDETRFPFRVADVRKIDECVDTIHQITGRAGQDPQVDFVVSSFVSGLPRLS